MKLAVYLCALLVAAVAAEELHEQWTKPFETFMMVDHPITPYVKKNPFEAQALSTRARAYIEANYKTPSSALLLDGLPTYSGTPVETAGLREIPINHPKCKAQNAPSNCESKLYQDYAIGRFALWLALPLVFAVLSILGCILFMVCKCCCMCSPCCKPKEQGYTNQEKYIPLGIMLVFCAIAIGASIYGIVANDRMSTTLVDDDDGLATVGDRLLQDAKDIFNKLADLTTRVLNLLDPTLAVVNALLADTTGLELGTTTLTRSVDTLAFNIRDLQITVPGNSTIYPNGTIPCGYCQTAFKSLNDTNTEIKQKADSSFLTLNDTKRMINEQFINAQRQIRNSSEDAKQQMQKALNSSQDIQDQMKKITNQIKDYEGIRRDIVFAIFSLPFIFTGLAILGGILKFSWLFTLNWFMGWTVLFLFWLLLAIHLPLSLALGDGCKLWDKGQEDPSVFSDSSESLNRTQAIVESCFLNTSLVEALGYDKDLNFTNKIKFPDTNFNINQIFNFTTLNKFQSDVNALTPASFGYNDNITIALFGQINNITAIDFSIIYTRLNIRDPLNLTAYDDSNGPPSDRDTVQVLQNNIIFQLNAEIAANNTLNDLKYNTTQIETRSIVLKADFSRFANATKQMELAVQDLFNVVRQFVLEATCGFLAERYGEIKNGVCDGALGSVAGMSVGFFGIAIALFPMTICAILLARRFGAKTANVEKIQDGNPDGIEMHKQNPDSGLPPTIPGSVTQGEQPPGYSHMLPPSDPMMEQPQVVVAPFPAVDASTGAMMPPALEGQQQTRLSIGNSQQQQPRLSIGNSGGFAPPPAFIPDSSQQLPPVSYEPPQIYNEAPSQPVSEEPVAMAPPMFIPGSTPEGGQPFPDGSASTGTSV